MNARRSAGLIGLVLIAAIVFWVTLRPTTVDAGLDEEIQWVLNALHRLGVPGWFQYRHLEFTANIAMFVPLGFFGGLLLDRRWWWALLALPVVSVCIEVTQLLLLPGRFATVSDVVANSLGGWIGALVAALCVARHRRGHRVSAAG